MRRFILAICPPLRWWRYRRCLRRTERLERELMPWLFEDEPCKGHSDWANSLTCAKCNAANENEFYLKKKKIPRLVTESNGVDGERVVLKRPEKPTKPWLLPRVESVPSAADWVVGGFHLPAHLGCGGVVTYDSQQSYGLYDGIVRIYFRCEACGDIWYFCFDKHEAKRPSHVFRQEVEARIKRGLPLDWSGTEESSLLELEQDLADVQATWT